MQEAFDLIVEKTAEALKKQGFEQSKDFEDDLGPAVLFVNKDAAYSIVFKTNDNMFELRSTNMTDDGPTAAGNLFQTGYLTRNRILCVKQRQSLQILLKL